MDKKEINSPKLTAHFVIWMCVGCLLLVVFWVITSGKAANLRNHDALMRSILDQRGHIRACSPPLEPDKRQLAEIEDSGLIPCCCRKAVENGGTVQRLILRPHPYPILTVLGM